MAPEGAITLLKRLTINAALGSAVIPILIAIHHIGPAMIFCVASCALDAVMKGIALDVPRKT